jgi:hypothetical protein
MIGDGSFVKEGYSAAVILLGSRPYAEPNYHQENDRPKTADLDYLARCASDFGGDLYI